MLKPSGVLAIAGTAPSFDFFESNGGWELKPERFRIHALATQRAAEEIGRAVGWTERDELAVAALIHDVGRLVISRLHPGYKTFFDAVSRTPEQRVRDEREQLGIDHALVGGVLARRWNLPQRLAVAIERHHSDDADGLAAMVAAADMVAHYSQGEAISPERLHAAVERCGLGADGLRDLLYELPYPRQEARPDQRALPALRPRAGRPQAPLRGHGLQADRRRDAALGLHDPHPPAQRLRQDRRCRSSPGRSHRARSRLDLVDQGLSKRHRDRVGAVAGPRRDMMFLMWVLTVSSLRSSSRAATVVDSPSARRWRICRWRRVSLPRLPLGGTAGSMKLSCARADSTARRSSSRPRGAGYVGGGAGLQGGGGCVALGAVAVGDDAEARRGPVDGADGVVAAQRRPAAVGPAHVDDRHVEAADVADQLEALLAADGLVDLEPVLEHSAHPEPDEWVTVDHKAVWPLAQDCFRSALVVRRLRP